MRAIKFRAWDKVSKKFLHPWPNGFHILGETTCFDLIGMQLKERSPEKTTLEMLNDVIITQFLEKKDCKAKEICEGDRVEFETETGTVTGIIFMDTEAGCWSIDYGNGKGDSVYAIGCNTLTVIGNVFENPELPL